MQSRWIQLTMPVAIIVLAFAGYALAYTGHILPHVTVGAISVGGLTQEKAEQELAAATDQLLKEGITLRVEGKSETIHLENIEFQASPEELARQALAIGRRGAWHQRFGERLRALFSTHAVEGSIAFDRQALRQEIAGVAHIFDAPGKDIRFLVQGTSVRVLSDTSIGKVLDQEEMETRITDSLARLDPAPLAFTRKDMTPVRTASSVPEALAQARRIIAAPLTLELETEAFTLSPAHIGSWIISTTGDRKELIPSIDRDAVSNYVATLAVRVNVEAQQPVIRIDDGKVIEFEPPRSGTILEEEKTVDAITAALQVRRTPGKPKTALSLSLKVTKPVSGTINGPSGIVELIGKATTTFAGSPANRISNIKNGVKFLTGIIVAPGEEFSTLKTLGTIDNTTGYLPELVIKENRTVPEFGGGLCQVSTTLFRSVLNAGLPVTARRNHSYRVSYYEKDGLGRPIGPGLDATIYEPDPDFKFRNDTGASILVHGYVKGDTVTFELYGTHDGRTATIKGPTLLTTIPAGDPIYTETDTLATGVIKQVETAHPGGSATATYAVKYVDGRTVTQEFKSYYRRWPAQFLVGPGTVIPTTVPTPSPSAR